MKKLSVLFLFGIVLCLAGCKSQYPDLKDGLYAEFTTNKGVFVAELYYQQTPLTVANFISLAEGTNPSVDSTYKGKPFYNGTIFHRVIEGFMIQGGDPTGTGTGGPGYKFPDEFTDSLRFEQKGILAMANAGPDTNGSQFFITVAATPWLDGRHSIFGQVVKGQAVVDTIAVVESQKPANRPLKDIIIETVDIIRKGKAAKNFNAPEVFRSEMEAIAQEEAAREKQIKQAKKEAAAHFEAIKPKAEKLDSGLMIYFDKKGDGEKPNIGDKVALYYEGYMTDGTLFDSNKKEVAKKFGALNQRRLKMGGYQPMVAPYSPDARLIAGFKEGLQQMRVGDIATLFIPSHLAYGKQGAGSAIPPNSNLIFKLELVKIKK